MGYTNNCEVGTKKSAEKKGGRIGSRPYDYEIGYRIKKVRTEMGLTQKELAERMDLSTETIIKLENANRQLTLHNAQSIKSILGISYDYLLDGKLESSDTVDQILIKAECLSKADRKRLISEILKKI